MNWRVFLLIDRSRLLKIYFTFLSKSNKDSSELSESMGSDKNNGNPMGAKRKDADGAIQIQRVSSSEEAQANGVVCDER